MASGSSSPRSAPEAPSALAALEEELTREVPMLLESMNRTSAEVNMFETRAGEAQERYQALLAEWSRMYETLHSQFGGAIDRVKPYFDAAQVFSAATHRVQAAAREFSAAQSQHARAKAHLRELEARMESGRGNASLGRDQQDGFSKATVQVMQCQQERDRLESEYARVLKEYQKSQEDLQAWRTQIGDATIKRTLPCFRQLQQQQLKLASERNRISGFCDRARAAKSAYNTSMRELDRISTAIHSARAEHASCAVITPSAASNSKNDGTGSDRPAPVGLRPEDAPEATPEVVFGEVMFGENPRVASKGRLRTLSSPAQEDDGPFA